MKAHFALYSIDRGNQTPAVVNPGEVFAFSGAELERLLENNAVREATDDEIALAKSKNGGKLNKSTAVDIKDELERQEAEADAERIRKDAAAAAAESQAEAERILADAKAEAERILADAKAAAEASAAEPSATETVVTTDAGATTAKGTGKGKKAAVTDDSDLDV